MNLAKSNLEDRSHIGPRVNTEQHSMNEETNNITRNNQSKLFPVEFEFNIRALKSLITTVNDMKVLKSTYKIETLPLADGVCGSPRFDLHRFVENVCWYARLSLQQRPFYMSHFHRQLYISMAKCTAISSFSNRKLRKSPKSIKRKREARKMLTKWDWLHGMRDCKGVWAFLWGR